MPAGAWAPALLAGLAGQGVVSEIVDVNMVLSFAGWVEPMKK
jgi:hypothetical protein